MATVNFTVNCKTPRPIPLLSEDQLKKFLSRIDKRGPNECWPWKNKTCGYPIFHIGRKGYRASRIAYFLHYGEDPYPLLVCHKCDNPPCCNAQHYFKGTHKDNTDDALQKNRLVSNWPKGNKHWTKLHPERILRGKDHMSQTHPEALKRGEEHWKSKLTDNKVRKIRRDLRPIKKIAESYGVSYGTIWLIKAGRIWKHVTLVTCLVQHDFLCAPDRRIVVGILDGIRVHSHAPKERAVRRN
jgi:hypothetical protein